MASVKSCEIIPCPFSDHCAVLFCATVPAAVSPGPGLWKLNTSILDEIEYFAFISFFWANWRCQKICFCSLSDWWEAGKSKIKGLTVSYCADRSKHGLPMEFYVKFWSIIGSDLVDVLNSCYSSGSLALSQRRGVISLIL